MATIAVYSLKGGVGKTTLTVHLALQAARASARRTLVWDLDPQAAATFLLETGPQRRERAQAIYARDVSPTKLIENTGHDRVWLLPADSSLRTLDQFLTDLGKRKRLAKLVETVASGFDHILLDCPPGLTPTTEQMVRAADLILVPVVPSPLAMRAFADFRAWLDREGHGRRLLPVFSMVDGRRALHRTALAEAPDWPVIPMASAFERGTALRGASAGAIADLWIRVERDLATLRT